MYRCLLAGRVEDHTQQHTCAVAMLQQRELQVGPVSSIGGISRPESLEHVVPNREGWNPKIWAAMIRDYSKIIYTLRKVFRKIDDPASAGKLVGPEDKVLAQVQL